MEPLGTAVPNMSASDAVDIVEIVDTLDRDLGER